MADGEQDGADEDGDGRTEVDREMVDRAAGPAERAVLGRNPYGSMIRIAVAIIGFVVLGGLLFVALIRAI
jgi:hypothetical protein